MTQQKRLWFAGLDDEFTTAEAKASAPEVTGRTVAGWLRKLVKDGTIERTSYGEYTKLHTVDPILAAESEDRAVEPYPTVTGATASGDGFDVEAAIAEQSRRFRNKARRAETKKRQTIRFPHGPAMLAFVGDQHMGNAGTDIERVFDEQDIIMSTPGAYVWQMGDVVDNFIVGRLQRENFKPSAPVWEQWEVAKHYMERWEDRLLAYTGGNHGAWTMAQTSVDYRRDICPQGVLYDGDEIQATVTVGHAEYRIWARHKWRGSSIYNPTHGQERAARFNDPNFDIYVGAHTHKGSMYREFIHEGKRKASIQTGAYKIHDDYAKTIGFPAHDASTACGVILHDDGSYFGAADLTALSRYMKAIY